METDKTVGPSSSLSSESPSFTIYSSQNLSDIAARVVSEFNFPHNDPFHDDFYSNDAVRDNDDDEESEFEFAVLCGADNPSPISADEIFSNGQIKPTYPLFDTNLVFQDDSTKEYPFNSDPPIRLPLRKLLIEERENHATTTSCSSSEGDELEGVPPDTYCVWAPKKEKKETKNGENKNDDVLMRKKSKSTGSSSKRWRIRDLLYRSNSDGKDTFVFLAPNHHHHGDESKKTVAKTTAKKFYLPYRQDLVGFFANANGISRTVRPF